MVDKRQKDTELFQELMEHEEIHAVREQLFFDVRIETGTLIQSLGSKFPPRIIKITIANILLEIVEELFEGK